MLGGVGELTCQHGVEGELHVAHGVAKVCQRRRDLGWVSASGIAAAGAPVGTSTMAPDDMGVAARVAGSTADWPDGGGGCCTSDGGLEGADVLMIVEVSDTRLLCTKSSSLTDRRL